MKIKRLLLGILSSLLFAVGFARAADHVDPITLDLAGKTVEPSKCCADTGSGDCVGPCDATFD